MTESVFYNLASSEGAVAIARLRQLGHAVGLHAVYPNVEARRAVRPRGLVAQPDGRELMSEEIPDAINVYGARYFSPGTYRSDSNQHWRSGCPHEELRASAFPWLQILVHPAIWVYPGATMGQTMRAMVEADSARRLAQLADDDIDLA